jgi:hypothetical protein
MRSTFALLLAMAALGLLLAGCPQPGGGDGDGTTTGDGGPVTYTVSGTIHR